MQGGRMSQHIERMKLGDTIDVKGPLGHFIYDGHSQFRNSGKKGIAKKMSMIAGGTGITPMFQIIKVLPSNWSSPDLRSGCCRHHWHRLIQLASQASHELCLCNCSCCAIHCVQSLQL